MTVRVDFSNKQLAYRVAHLQGRNELIAKAIGYKKDQSLTVCDATAGLGKESFLLAALGCDVQLFERNPTIAQMLKEGLQHAQQDPQLASIIARMHLHDMCAIEFLNAHPDYQPEIIYCDPMFPERSKSALVKKDMQYLQSVVGDDPDGERLVQVALEHAKKRVVVKRSLKAPILFKTPSFSLKARSHRFDVYLC